MGVMVVQRENPREILSPKTMPRQPLRQRRNLQARAQNALLLPSLLPQVLERHPQPLLPLLRQRLQMLLQEL